MPLQHGMLLQPKTAFTAKSAHVESRLIPPYGGELVNLLVDEQRARYLKRASVDLPSLELSQRQLGDLELLANGAYSPLRGFMGRSDYTSVLNQMSMTDGTFWPMPVTLDVGETLATQLEPGCQLVLRDAEGAMLAVLRVSEIWQVDKPSEAKALYGTSHPDHPGVAYLLHQAGTHYVAGELEAICLPEHYDHRELRTTPLQLRRHFLSAGHARCAAFQASNPLSRREHEWALSLAAEYDAQLLIQPLVGVANLDSPHYFTRVRSYRAILPHFPRETNLVLLPLDKRMAGMRELLWHAIIHRNYGCAYFVIDKGCYNVPAGQDGASFAMEEFPVLAASYEDTIDVKFLPISHIRTHDTSVPSSNSEMADGQPCDNSIHSISHTLLKGIPMPEDYTYPQVADQLRRLYPARSKQGLTVLFTGLSGAGKSTLAKLLAIKLMENSERQVSLLDGDLLRKHLSSELGFSREHRDINVRRIGYVSSEITKHRGIAICAPIAPYRETRRMVRKMIEPFGGFFEIYVATPLETCEQRDCKGLYAKARAGLIKEFTGISDPYEIPEAPEVVVDTAQLSAEEAVQRILHKLRDEGFI